MCSVHTAQCAMHCRLNWCSTTCNGNCALQWNNVSWLWKSALCHVQYHIVNAMQCELVADCNVFWAMLVANAQSAMHCISMDAHCTKYNAMQCELVANGNFLCAMCHEHCTVCNVQSERCIKCIAL